MAVFSPVKPKDIKAILPTGDDNICQLILKFLKLQIVIYRWYKYVYASNGAFTATYKVQLCDSINACPDAAPTNA